MPEVSARLGAFLDSAPLQTLSALTALAAAESLSDGLARQLMELACPDQYQLDAFVSALHLSGFVVERNSEWHLTSDERAFLSNELLKNQELYSRCHKYLAEVATLQIATDATIEIPRYLLGPVGRAYHQTALSVQDGLFLYRNAYRGSLAERWLAARLSNEQQEQKIIPEGALEPAFLRGMVLYGEGQLDHAMRVLRSVAYSDERREEVAIASHLYARHLRRRDPQEAERLLRRSLEIGEAIKHDHHQAQVLHTLGDHLWHRDPQEAERLLRRSLEILDDLNDRYGQAQVLHTLGDHLWRHDPQEAERLLRRSLAIGEAIKHHHRQAQVLHTLGDHLWRRDPQEAEHLLRQSLAILEGLDDRHSQAQVLHTLGDQLWRRDSQEAERLLRRSLEILDDLNDRYGQAQVLHTLGKHISALNQSEAEALLRRSLAIGEEIRNLRHQAIVLLTLGKLFWPTNPEEGRTLMLRSLNLERKGGNRYGEQLVLRELLARGIDVPAG